MTNKEKELPTWVSWKWQEKGDQLELEKVEKGFVDTQTEIITRPTMCDDQNKIKKKILGQMKISQLTKHKRLQIKILFYSCTCCKNKTRLS